MAEKATAFFKMIRGKKIAVVGIGITNIGVIRLLCEKGAVIKAYDKRPPESLGEYAAELEELGVELKSGDDYLKDLDADILFRTPGMSFFEPELMEFRAKGGVVTSEMEVFFDVCPCPVIAVTGSDGKTTTTSLIAAMLEEAGHTVHLGGNIGRALLPHVESMRDTDFAVVELSSFQLISMRLAPQVSVVTNVTPNHLDVHKSMSEYIDAKRNIFAHQNAFSVTILGLDNEITASFAPEVRGRLRLFSLEKPVQHGAYLSGDGTVIFKDGDTQTPIMKASDIRLPGRHNVANYLAAISAAFYFVSLENIRKVAREFGGVEHRIEFVRELDGVKWFNDSIATSPTRAVAGLKSFTQKLILIAGGYDKNISFEPLAPELVRAVKLLILTGPTATKIEAAVLSEPNYKDGSPAIVHAKDIPEAVEIARKAAVSGDIVSLSPACASFDAYPNFEARGKHFKSLVNEL